MPRTGQAFANGIPELLLLRLLGQREMYGYEIAKAVHVLTEQAISIGESVLYPVLHSLEARRMVRSKSRSVAGRTRVYYTITRKGRDRLAELTEDWRRVSGAVEAALQGKPHG